MSNAVADAVAKVATAIGRPARLGVAFSGGVDSSVLLAVAVRALGPRRTLAILGVSPSLAADERAAAHAVAAYIGAPILEIETHEGDNPAYRANGPDRCFHCKDELFTHISDEVAARYGLTAVAYGEHADDAIRAVAHALGLPSADKPAAPCLASRIPHFQEVTPEKLRQVEAAESALRSLGLRECRVRHHGDIARIELPVEDLVRAVSTGLREDIHRAVTAAGFRFVALDVAGIQSGAFTLSLVPVRG